MAPAPPRLLDNTMFEKLIQMIEEHPTYASALEGAIARELPIVLNYHTHAGEGSYCVSICTKAGFPVAFFEDMEGTLEELVHVRGFGKDREQCIPLLSVLGKELRAHFKLTADPEFWLDNKPLERA